MTKFFTPLNILSSRHSLLANVIAGPVLILLLALSGLVVEMRFLSDHHNLLKQQQVLAHSAAELNIALKTQSQLWLDYLLYQPLEEKSWQRFRKQERATLALANKLLVQVEQDRLQSDVRSIIYALEILRITYQEKRSSLLQDSANFSENNSTLGNIDTVPSALIKDLYQKIHMHANETSNALRQQALVMSGLFALLLIAASLAYSRWSTRHTQRFLDRQEKSHRRVQWLLQHDYLTRLLTRTQLIQETDVKIRGHQPLYAFHFSLSNVKNAAQSQGHSVQDQLIRIAAQRLLTQKRPQDILARSIGEEFILIAEDDDSLALRRYARTLLSKIEQDFSVAGFRYQIHCSLGISHYPEHADNSSELLRCADIAAVHARSQRLQAPCLYSAVMSERIRQKIELVSDLKTAISKGEITVLFQPQVDIKHRQIVGIEALARLTTNNTALNYPDVFIPLAEETGLIHSLSKAVCRQAIAHFENWWKLGNDITLAINVSPKQLETSDFVDFLQELCHCHQVPSHKIDIELTESSYIDSHYPQLNRLRELGFRLSIDDFGTGYSNLGYLTHFVPQQLKIDKSFIDSITHSDRKHALVESIVGLAKSQNIEVVAEGIETEIQAHILKRMGVEIGQGYLFSRPVDALSLQAQLKTPQPSLQQSV
jgi:diguanylate cyclase (GGDEF)-like protein